MGELGYRCWRGLVVLGLTASSLVACSTTEYLPIMSAGSIGCPPAEIAIVPTDSYLGLQSWQAQCRGHVFQCSNAGRGVECTEMLPPVDKAAAQPPVQVPAPVQPPAQ